MGARTYWSSPVPPLTSADGPAGTSSTFTDVSPSPQIVIPAFLPEVGTRIRAVVTGNYSSNSASITMSAGFFTAAVGTAIGSATVVGTTSTMTTLATATNWPFIMYYYGEYRTLGSSGSLFGQGWAKQGTSLTLFAASDFALPITSAARTVTVNTTQANYIAVGVSFAGATGAPSFTCNELTVELLG